MPKKNTMPFIPIGVPGAQKPYPFGKMEVGDVLRVPTPRCAQHSLYSAIVRFQNKHSGHLFRIETEAAGDDEDFPYYRVTRVQ